MSLLVETTADDPASLAAPLRGLVRDLDVNQPVFNVQTLASLYERRAIQIPLRVLRVVGTMGIVGLTLALIGLYGLVSYSVARRTREIGLRMAVGADRSDVLKMVLRQGLMLSMAGILVGGVASVAVARPAHSRPGWSRHAEPGDLCHRADHADRPDARGKLCPGTTGICRGSPPRAQVRIAAAWTRSTRGPGARPLLNRLQEFLQAGTRCRHVKTKTEMSVPLALDILCGLRHFCRTRVVAVGSVNSALKG